MRSPSFTLLLLLITMAVSGMAVVHLSKGDLSSLGIFSVPVSKEGEHLYNFDQMKVRRILLSGNKVRAECVFEDGTWKIVSPWKDRMDPRAASAILNFTLGTQVVDAIPQSKGKEANLISDQEGYVDGTFNIRIEDKDKETLAKYRLGRPAAYRYYDAKQDTETRTVFVQPQDKNRKDYIYACTGDIHLLFKDGFRALRDHHPFFFNPLALETIRMRNSEGELFTLNHLGVDVMKSPDTREQKYPWRIVMPLELRTDPQAVGSLISGLFNLQAKKILSRSEVTLPTAEAGKGEMIALKHFGEAQETTLEIYPPATPDAETVYATVSNRPDTVFELIRKPLPADPATGKKAAEDDVVTLASLPDNINELRNQMLTNIKGSVLGGIMISPSTGAPISLVRESPTSDFKVVLDGVPQQPNLIALQSLLSLISRTKVAGFRTDAATEMGPYGLDHPSLTLRFVAFEGNEGFELAFGQGKDGTWYGNRTGTPTVVVMSDSFIGQIAIHPWDWRDTFLWSISPVDVKEIHRTIGDQLPLELKWNWGEESWKVKDGGKDRSAEINGSRARHLLDAITSLKAASWLSPDNEEAAKALSQPLLSLSIAVDTYNEQGQKDQIPRIRELRIAPGTTPTGSRIYYGRIDGEISPFLLNEMDVRNLAANVFADG